MKTIQISLLALLLTGFSVTLPAHNGDKGNDFSSKIRSVLSTPRCLKDKPASMKVTVQFVVNQNGDVIEVKAKTDNREVKEYVENNFLRINLQGLTPCVTNTVDVNFSLR